MTTIIAQFRVFAIMVALSLVVSACGEPVATDQVGMNALDRGNRAIIPDYGRIDRGMSRQDAMVTPPRDVGVSDQGTTNPEVYIPYGQCPDGVDFVGQVLGSNSASPNGGTPQFLPFERVYNAGIETIYARLPERTGGDDPRPVTVDIDIERATVVATRPKVNVDNSVDTSRGRFWIADGRRTVEVFLALSVREVPSFDVRVGQIISFRAQTIGLYGLRAQIQKASDFILHEDGPAHNSVDAVGAVAIFEPDRPLEGNDIPNLVRVTGLLEGEAQACGGTFFCWAVAGRSNLTYRTEATDLRAGTCVSFVGPVSGFGDTVQLEAFNPDWVRRYQRGAAFEESCLTGSECASGVCISLGDRKFCSMACEFDSDCPARYDCTFNRCLPSFGGVCPEEVTFAGQYQGVDAMAPDGGRLSLAAYPESFEANIATVLAQAPPASSNDPMTVTTEISINGAVVTSTHSVTELIGPDSDRQTPASQSRFTLADGFGSVEVYLDVGGAGATPNFQIRTGMVVSLLATQLDRYQGKAQIRRAVWASHDVNQVAHPEVGVGTNALVSVFEPDRAFRRSDLSRIIRVTGTLEGSGDRCGADSRCWTLNYGYGEPVVVRTANENAFTGACATFTGPLGFYNGSYQLDVVNPSWLIVNDGEDQNP
jgi:hypothetical protein